MGEAMTGYQSKKAAALDKLDDDDDTQVYQRPWVGLTPDEITIIGNSMRIWNSWSITDVYTAIEAKLKDKNT
jgi:hypothetical protein